MFFTKIHILKLTVFITEIHILNHQFSISSIYPKLQLKLTTDKTQFYTMLSKTQREFVFSFMLLASGDLQDILIQKHKH